MQQGILLIFPYIDIFRAHTPINRTVCTVRMVSCESRHHPQDLRSDSQDHHPSTNSVQKTACCNSISSAPDDGRMRPNYVELFFCDVLLTVQLSIFISVINQLDAQSFCFTISLFHASTYVGHMCSSSVDQNCITQLLISF